MTIVVDMEKGRIVYVSNGKGADALDALWPKLRRAGCRIEAVSSDLSEAFISAVREHLPDAVQVYDHFHIVRLMNEKLDGVPRFRFPKGSRCHVYNLPVLRRLKEGEPLFITEGASDCWAMLSSGHKAIAIPSATLLKRDELKQLFGSEEMRRLNVHIYPD